MISQVRIPDWLAPAVAAARHPEGAVAVALDRVDPGLAVEWVAHACAEVAIASLGYDADVVSIYRDIAALWMARRADDVSGVLARVPVDARASVAPDSLLRAPLRVWAAATVSDDTAMALTMGGPIAPAFPLATGTIARRVAIGERPSDVSGGLTAAQAHQWLTEAPSEEPGTWLMNQHGHDVRAHSVRIAKWALWALGGRHRRAMDAMGLTQHLDLVRDEDLVTDRDLPGEVHIRSRQRREDIPDGIGPVPPWHHGRRQIRAVRLLRDPVELASQGDAERHCVGGYAAEVVRGRTHIYAVTVLDRDGKRHTSTVEVGPDRQVRQHQGRCNSAPPPLCAAAWQRQWEVWDG